jgi:glycosyltransferase involved in cell wall biosynthesis
VKKRLLIIIDSLHKGGAEKMAVELAIALSGHHIVFVYILNSCNKNETYLRKLQDAKISYNQTKNSFVFVAVNLFFYIRQIKPDLIFSFLLRGNIFSAFYGRILGVNKIIGGIRSSMIDPKKVFLQKALHRYFHDITVTNNYASLGFLKTNGFNLKKLMVIHNFVENQNILKRRFSYSSTKRTILTVARFEKVKDYYTALQAVKFARNVIPNIEYIIVGWGSNEILIKNYVKELHLGENVQIIIDPPDVYEYYSNADIYLSTSLFEGLSNSILEAMSIGLPIISTNVGDNEYLVNEGINGFLHPVRNPLSISNSIIELCNNDALRYSFSIKSQEIIRKSFSKELFVKKYLELVNSE